MHLTAITPFKVIQEFISVPKESRYATFNVCIIVTYLLSSTVSDGGLFFPCQHGFPVFNIICNQSGFKDSQFWTSSSALLKEKDQKQQPASSVCLNFASSDNKIHKNSENNSIADDTGNRREQVHLHGTST